MRSSRWLFLVLSALSLPFAVAACGPKAASSIKGDRPIVYPAPPQTARIQFLTRMGSSRDISGGPSFFKQLIGETEGSIKPIMKPYGIAIHNGRLFICDTKLGGVDVIDLKERRFEYFTPGGMGRLMKPVNCAVDKELGHLYVADPTRGQVVVFDEAGNYVASFAEGVSARPTDVFVGRDLIWVADLSSRKVQVFTKGDYRLQSSFPDVEPSDSSYLRLPINLWVTADRVYVSDFGSFSVKVYSREGEYLMTIGSYGQRPGQLARPKGIAVDRDSNLYVVDSAFENIQVFDREGKLLMWFGGTYRAPGDMWLPAKVVIDYDNLDHFRRYVQRGFDLKYLILVTNQFGPDKVSVYGFVGPTGGADASR